MKISKKDNKSIVGYQEKSIENWLQQILQNCDKKTILRKVDAK